MGDIKLKIKSLACTVFLLGSTTVNAECVHSFSYTLPLPYHLQPSR